MIVDISIWDCRYSDESSVGTSSNSSRWVFLLIPSFVRGFLNMMLKKYLSSPPQNRIGYGNASYEWGVSEIRSTLLFLRRIILASELHSSQTMIIVFCSSTGLLSALITSLQSSTGICWRAVLILWWARCVHRIASQRSFALCLYWNDHVDWLDHQCYPWDISEGICDPRPIVVEVILLDCVRFVLALWMSACDPLIQYALHLLLSLSLFVQAYCLYLL